MQQIELTQKQQDILKAAWQAYKDDYQEWQQTRKPRGWRATFFICKSLFDRDELNQLAALGLVENSKLDNQWRITKRGIKLAQVIENGTVPTIDPAYTDAAQFVAARRELTAPLLQEANLVLFDQIRELQNVINGQDAELAALRQQYADQSDELARCQERAKKAESALDGLTDLTSALLSNHAALVNNVFPGGLPPRPAPGERATHDLRQQIIKSLREANEVLDGAK